MLKEDLKLLEQGVIWVCPACGFIVASDMLCACSCPPMREYHQADPLEHQISEPKKTTSERKKQWY